ncbi:MAG TPA: hypothetical protein VH722_07000 [Alphaproteobacteria bacterium]|nr:hypothetical protein [Alphaproteobacteria bacterium]
MTDSKQLHTEIAANGPYPARIGSALITMVEPHVGHEHDYNRWYEDDHFNSGAMAMPWMFSGRRWVAPKSLQAYRYPADSAIAQPLEAGKYISIYWLTDGRYDDHMAFTVATNKRLRADDRVHMERTHVYTSFQSYRGASYRDEKGPRDIHALEYPYGGLVVEVIDAAPGKRDALIEWLKSERVPQAVAGTDVAQCLFFQPTPLPADKMPYVKDVEGVDNRLTLLWFTEGKPTDSWDKVFAKSGDAVARSGLGRVELVAPFIPTLPGTDRYVDELR